MPVDVSLLTMDVVGVVVLPEVSVVSVVNRDAPVHSSK
jgi:hypothetical protein